MLDGDDTVAKIAGATIHILRVHKKLGSEGSIWGRPVVHEEINRGMRIRRWNTQ